MQSVAPLVGAWIETEIRNYVKVAKLVAPLVGAWIETVVPTELPYVFKSHPSWVRGLKPDSQTEINLD